VDQLRHFQSPVEDGNRTHLLHSCKTRQTFWHVCLRTTGRSVVRLGTPTQYRTMSQTVESAELPTCAVCCQRVVWALRPSERPLLQGKMLNAIQELQPEACTAVRGGALTVNSTR
jgi:hypothetical protein